MVRAGRASARRRSVGLAVAGAGVVAVAAAVLWPTVQRHGNTAYAQSSGGVIPIPSADADAAASYWAAQLFVMQVVHALLDVSLHGELQLDCMQFVKPVRGAVAVGPLMVWPQRRSASMGGQPLKLTSTEFRLLEVLARNAGHPVEKRELAETCLGRALGPYDRSIDTHLSSLRRKLGRMADGRSYIETVYRVGYQLIRD